MSEGRFTVEGLHGMVTREAESDVILEIDINTYTRISEFVGQLKRQEFDGVENEIRDSMVKTITDLTEILIRTRLEKGLRTDGLESGNLLDEEEYVLDAEEEKRHRMKQVVDAASRGRTRLLEHISQLHKNRRVVVRFVQYVDALTGADYSPYGPFKEEDVATIPYDNARALVAQGSAVRVTWID